MHTRLILGVAVILLLFGGGCIPAQPNTTKTTEEETVTLRVGVIESLSGTAAYYGEENRKGVEVAKQEMAKKYPHIVVETFHEDSLYTPKGGVDAYTKLKSTQTLDAVITHASPVALAVWPMVQKDGILQMAVSASAGTLTTPNDLLFRVSPVTDFEAKTTAKFLKDTGYKKLAILYFNNDIGVSLINSLKDALKEVPTIQIPVEEKFLIETTDFRTILLKVKESGADSVYVGALAGHISNILKQAKELGVEAQFLGFRTGEDPVLLKNAAAQAEGFIYTYGFDVTKEEETTTAFVDAFQATYGKAPDGYAAEGYEGMKLIIESFNACGKDYTCIQSYLGTLKDYPSVFGLMTFDSNGDVVYSFHLKTVKNGQFVPYSK